MRIVSECLQPLLLGLPSTISKLWLSHEDAFSVDAFAIDFKAILSKASYENRQQVFT